LSHTLYRSPIHLGLRHDQRDGLSIFNTLQNNLASIDFSILLIGVMTIADEVDSSLLDEHNGVFFVI